MSTRRGKYKPESTCDTAVVSNTPDTASASPADPGTHNGQQQQQSTCAAGSRCRFPQANNTAARVNTQCCNRWAHVGCASMCDCSRGEEEQEQDLEQEQETASPPADVSEGST
ncbi:unnamed protein product, partial [Ectocarpus sp. 12 AP-2014]